MLIGFFTTVVWKTTVLSDDIIYELSCILALLFCYLGNESKIGYLVEFNALIDFR